VKSTWEGHKTDADIDYSLRNPSLNCMHSKPPRKIAIQTHDPFVTTANVIFYLSSICLRFCRFLCLFSVWHFVWHFDLPRTAAAFSESFPPLCSTLPGTYVVYDDCREFIACLVSLIISSVDSSSSAGHMHMGDR